MWIARTGSLWRDLPDRYPNWRSVYSRWRRWVRQALWGKILALVENAFARLKSTRRIATRYDQTVASFSAFVSLARVFLWLM